MVRYNWIETKLIELGIKRPKQFKKEAREQIEQNTLNYIKKFGRRKWVPVSEIFEKTLEQTDLFNSQGGKFWFASQGVKSKINSATLKWRSPPYGYPIISGKGHKGYRYADENCDDFIDVWDEKFSGWEKRKTKLDKEKLTDIKLIEKIIEKLITNNRLKEAQQLKEVLVKYQK